MNKLYLLLILGVIFLSIKTFAINQSTKIDNDNELPKKETIISDKKDIFPNKNEEQPPKKEPIVHSNKFSLKIILNLSINFLKEHWIDLTQLLLSMIIIFISWQGSKIQLRSAKATHKVNQYKERLKVYMAVETLYLHYVKNQLNNNVLYDFLIEIQPSRWLFGKTFFEELLIFYNLANQLKPPIEIKHIVETNGVFERKRNHIKNLFDSYVDTEF